jgi:hypothetical protein
VLAFMWFFTCSEIQVVSSSWNFDKVNGCTFPGAASPSISMVSVLRPPKPVSVPPLGLGASNLHYSHRHDSHSRSEALVVLAFPSLIDLLHFSWFFWMLEGEG